MRILHIDTGSEMRGGQYQVFLLLNGLRDAGHESILMAREHAPLARAAAAAGFETHAAETKQLWKLSLRTTLVHCHDAHAHTMAAIGSRRRFVVSRRVAFRVRRSVASMWKYHRPARFLAVSRFVAAELAAAGIRNDKIEVVYDGVDTASATHTWNPAGPIVALDSSDPQKDRDLVQRAAAIARTSIVYSNDLSSALAGASLFLYITRSEGLGSAALFAMSRGVPVIASAVGGLTEVFEDGISGVFTANRPEEIAQAIQCVLGNPDLARTLSQNGPKRIAECFTKEHLVCRTLASYERALAA